jgi:hypothetical protein
VRRREPPAAGWGEGCASFDVFEAHEVSVADPVGVEVMVADQPKDSLLGHAESLRGLGDRDIAGRWRRRSINHFENTIVASTVSRKGRRRYAALRGCPSLPSAAFPSRHHGYATLKFRWSWLAGETWETTVSVLP